MIVNLMRISLTTDKQEALKPHKPGKRRRRAGKNKTGTEPGFSALATKDGLLATKARLKSDAKELRLRVLVAKIPNTSTCKKKK